MAPRRVGKVLPTEPRLFAATRQIDFRVVFVDVTAVYAPSPGAGDGRTGGAGGTITHERDRTDAP
jgi:hypothetical protein